MRILRLAAHVVLANAWLILDIEMMLLLLISFLSAFETANTIPQRLEWRLQPANAAEERVGLCSQVDHPISDPSLQLLSLLGRAAHFLWGRPVLGDPK